MNPPPLPPRRGPFVRVLLGVWNTINFTRKLVLNLLFFALLLLALGLIARSGGALAPLGEGTTLVLEPQGALVEQFSADPLDRALRRRMGEAVDEVQLRDLLRALDAAKDDARIERVVLRLDGLRASGYASLRELGQAVAALREAGKPVLAFGESFDQAQYLLAVQADAIYLDPDGAVDISGLHRYRQYYREALHDKLGVDVHLFKVGEYKSAAEPYLLDAASNESKEADLFWMNDLWQRWLADVGARRQIAPEALRAGIQARTEGVIAAEGDLAQFALGQRWVDGLKTSEDFDALLAGDGEADPQAGGGFRQIALEAYLQHLDAKSVLDTRPQVAVVVAEGAISGGEQPAGSVGGVSTSALLRSAREDDAIKAVVLRVNSPGGEVFASEQIRREVQRLKDAGKPVVVSFGNVAASGGYWISMNADAIYADESTITGSIGIFGLLPTLPRTLERIGVHTDGVSTTGAAAVFDPAQPLPEDMARLVQSVIDKGYRDFTGKVAAARGRSRDEIDAVARGRVWSGAQAHERGLVDAFGGIRDAIAEAAQRAGLEQADAFQVHYVEREVSAFERVLLNLTQSRLAAAWLGENTAAHALIQRAAPQFAQDVHLFEHALRATPGRPVTALAYCFCTL